MGGTLRLRYSHPIWVAPTDSQKVRNQVMSKYEISQIRSMDNEVRFVIYNKEERAFFAGYDFMGSVIWQDNFSFDKAMDLDEAREIVKNLEAAD